MGGGGGGSDGTAGVWWEPGEKTSNYTTFLTHLTLLSDACAFSSNSCIVASSAPPSDFFLTARCDVLGKINSESRPVVMQCLYLSGQGASCDPMVHSQFSSELWRMKYTHASWVLSFPTLEGARCQSELDSDIFPSLRLLLFHILKMGRKKE